MTVLELPGWRDKAACLAEDPDLFYPDTPAQLAQARRVCRGCPVRADCVRDALRVGDQWAVRGGLVPGEYGPLPAAVTDRDLAAVLARADEADAPAGNRHARALVTDLVHLLAAAAAPPPLIPPDPDAAEHRRVLLEELDAYDAAHPVKHPRWNGAGMNQAAALRSVQIRVDDQLEVFAWYRRNGDSIPQAARQAGVCSRTGQRYENRLRAEGRATWRRQEHADAA